MMPPGDTPSKPTATTKACSSPNTKDHDNSDQQGGGGRKTTKTAAAEQGLKCPRCDSPNTKFCYYNNYSLTQPRHFCKTCRRYWTKGGALRNVPIGGGCRKNKKGKPSSSSSISYSRVPFSCDSSRDSASSSDLAGLRYLHGLSSPPMDFHLGGLTFPPVPSRLQHHPQPPMPTTAAFYNNHFSSFGDVLPGATTTCAPASSAIDPLLGSSLIGLNYPFCSSDGSGGGGGAIIHGGVNNNNFEGSSNLASSIESLSSLNQDLHWKLQQQRLAMLFVGDHNHNHKDGTNHNSNGNNVSFSPVVVDLDNHHHHQQQQRLQPILFQNLEISKADAAGATVDADSRATEWFFGNSHAPPTPTTATRSGCNNGNESNWMMSSNSGVHLHGWADLQPQQQYSSLP